MSFRTRIAMLTGAAAACAVVVAAIVSYGVVRDQLYRQVDDSLKTRVAELSTFSVSGFSGTSTSGGQIQIVSGAGTGQGGRTCSLQPTGTPLCYTSTKPGPGVAGLSNGQVIAVGVPSTSLGAAGGYTQFVDAGGISVLSPGESQRLPVTAADLAVAKGQSPPTLRTEDVGGVPVRVVTAPMASGLAVMVARPLDETEAVLGSLRNLLLLICVAGVALAAGLGILVARGTMRPVRRLIAATEHVAGTRDLTRRIDVRGGSELDKLAGSFNRMLEALDRSEATQRQLVADASHELRTPLTSLRTNIEVLAQGRRISAPERRRLLASVEGQIERLGNLVAGLIDLARGSEQVTAESDVVLADVVDAVAATARAHWPELTFAVTADDSVVHGDAVRLELAITNLVDNAAKWSAEDGTVDVSVGRGEVRVRDHGPGVDPDDRTRVFDRFWRAPAARQMPGSGLGLAIVRQTAQAHRGDVSVDDAAGGGAVFVLRLPLAGSSGVLS